jgi:hypothetical protein
MATSIAFPFLDPNPLPLNLDDLISREDEALSLPVDLDDLAETASALAYSAAWSRLYAQAMASEDPRWEFLLLSARLFLAGGAR